MTTAYTDSLICFTDGACSKNGHVNAKGGYGVHWPAYDHLNISERLNTTKPTNNSAELTAVLTAFKQADEIDPDKIKPLTVYTDSQLIVNTFGSSIRASPKAWIHKWKENNWKTTTGDVKNKDIIERISDYLDQRKYEFIHVKAHTKNNDPISTGNRKADRLAVSGMNKVASKIEPFQLG